MSAQSKVARFMRRKKRVNAIIKNSNFDYRLIVNRSNKYTYGQIVDKNGVTSVMMSDEKMKGATKVERAKQLGIELAKKAAEKGITKAVFDRNGFLYHGRVAALCDGAREGGLSI